MLTRSTRLLLALLALLSIGLAFYRQLPARAAGQTSTVYLPLVIGAGGNGPAPLPQVSPRYDAGRAASATIGPEGGTISADSADGVRFTLSIPPDALDFSELITVTPALQLDGLPLSGGLIGAVNIEPAGLELYAPATLTIASAKVAPAGMYTVGATFRAAGENFHLIPLAQPAAPAAALASGEVVITVSEPVIRPISAAYASQGDIQSLQAALPPLVDLDIEEGIIANATLLGLTGQIRDSLGVYYTERLTPHLEQAASSPATLDATISEYAGWLYFVQTNGLTTDLAAEIAAARGLLERAIGFGATDASLRCTNQHKPEEGFALLRWARWARKLIPGSPIIAQIEAELTKCLQFKLTFHSTITLKAPGGGYVYEVKSEVPLKAVGGTRATGSAPLTWLDYRWTGPTGPCAFNTSGTGSTFFAEGNQLGLSIAPVSRTSPAVKVSLRYNPGQPTEHMTIVCSGGSAPQPDTHNWVVYFTNLHQYEFDSQGLNTTVEITDLGTFTGWVYQNDLSISEGVISEDTRIDLEHTPQP